MRPKAKSSQHRVIQYLQYAYFEHLLYVSPCLGTGYSIKKQNKTISLLHEVEMSETIMSDTNKSHIVSVKVTSAIEK